MTVDEEYIGFLDLFGVRELARSNRERYIDVLTDFREKVDETLSEFSDKPQASKPGVYLFSDCIYYQTQDLESILDFTSRLRHLLMMEASEPIFFSGAIGKGQLSPEQLNPDNDKANGYVFGTDAAKVYCEQEALRGIGVNLSDSIVKSIRSRGLEHRILNNVYLPKADSIQALPFSDLKFNPATDLDREDTYSRCFKSLSDAATMNPRFARNYIPLLVNLFTAQNYKALPKDVTGLNIERDNDIRDRLHRRRYFEEEIDVTDSESEYALNSTNTRWHPYNTLRRGWLKRYEDKIPGREIVNLATIAQIFSENAGMTPSEWSEEEQMILQTVVDDNKVLSYIHRLPDSVLPHAMRGQIMFEASKRNYDR